MLDRSINTPFVMQQWSTQPSGVLQFFPGPFELLKNGAYIVKVRAATGRFDSPPLHSSFAPHLFPLCIACGNNVWGVIVLSARRSPPSTCAALPQMWNNPVIRPSGPMCAGVTSNTGDITCFKRIDFDVADQLVFS